MSRTISLLTRASLCLIEIFSSQPYYLRDQDSWTKIDYTAEASSWMKPLVKGKVTGLVEIPANW